MFRILVLAFAFLNCASSFASCLPPSTNETGCHIDRSNLQRFKDYLGCRQDNYHEYCLGFVEKGVSLPGIGYLGTSTDRDAYARKYADVIAKSPELKAIAVDVILAAMATPPGGTGGTLSEAELIERFERIQKESTGQLRKALDRQAAARSSANKSVEIRARLLKLLEDNPRTVLEPILKGDMAKLMGAPEGYVGFQGSTLSEETVAQMRAARPTIFLDTIHEVPPVAPGQDTRTLRAQSADRMAVVRSGADMEGFHPDVEKLRQANMMREFPKVNTAEVTKAMQTRLPAVPRPPGVPGVGSVAGGAATGLLVALVANAYEQNVANKLDCLDRYPFVPVTGTAGKSAGRDDCRPVPFPDITKKERFMRNEYPREISIFLGLPEKEQLGLLNTKAGKHFGVCDYYSRAFDSAFNGASFCPGTAKKAAETGSAVTTH